jgi:Pvc16 N-terminal domain
MIDLALQFVKESLDRFLMNKFSLEESVVQLNRLVDQEGKRPEVNSNQVILCLINLAQETNGQYYNRPTTGRDGMATTYQPSMHFNMDLVCVADFDAYDESLRFLSAIIEFFQSNPSISLKSNDSSQQFNEKDTLRLCIESESYFNTHNLWSSIGAKYQPSVIVRASHISVDGRNIIQRSRIIKSVEVTGG